jgi:hypothetical protein
MSRAAVQVLTFVLNPKNSDHAAMSAPGLALQSLLSLPAAARDLAPKLLQLLVVKAVCCEMEALRGSLLPVIARSATAAPLDTVIFLSCFFFPFFHHWKFPPRECTPAHNPDMALVHAQTVHIHTAFTCDKSTYWPS